jgi:hypothetical protein
MRSTNVSLDAIVAPQVKERRIHWTTHANLLAWLDKFKIFLIEFGFAAIGGDGEPIFDKEMKHWILNIGKTEISVDVFFVTGGEHVTSNDMFKAPEINRWTAEALEREKYKKGRVDYHRRREAALPILDRLENEMENNIGRHTSKGLEALLRWKGVSVSKMGNVASRRILYQQFAEGGLEVVSIPAPWTENDRTKFGALRNAPIEMIDTSYGCFLVQQKRDAERAYTRRCLMRRKLTSSRRWQRSMWWAPTICNLRHLASPPFS